jgi:Ser-Thr-rich glycosyl-phosphatidyl-inositol-anchored membrane family protein
MSNAGGIEVMRIARLIAVLVVVVLVSTLGSAADFSFTGTFTDVNQVQYITFTVGTGAHVVIQSYGYAGGTNAAGTNIAAGGFDPLIAVFQGTDNSATLLYKNDDAFECAHVKQDSVSRQCYDTYMDKAGALLDPTTVVGGFDPGTYTLVLMNYANFAKGPTLGDGFTLNGGGAACFGAPRGVTAGSFVDCAGFTRTGKWALDVKGADSAALANAPQASVAVVSPNGGESFAAGATMPIQWTATGVAGNVNLALLKGGTGYKSIATGVPASAGTFNWALPTTIPVGSDYTVRVMSATNTNIVDISNATFSVTPSQASVTVVAPNGGESFAAGSTLPIQWSAGGGVSTVNIALLKAGAGYISIATGVPAAQGSFSWTLPTSLPVESDYTIRVMSATDGSIVDVSNAAFSVTASQAAVTVVAPNGGESWNAGSTHTIQWTAGAGVSSVNIALLKAGVGYRSIATGVAASAGSFSWTLPLSLPVAGDYTVRVMSTDGTVVDVSNATFSVGPSALAVTVVSPNGGENWKVGSTQTIQWTASGVTGTVNIALMKAGVGYRSIATGVSATAGSFSWTLPANLPIASDYTIRVMTSDGLLVDVSNAAFSVTP